MDWREGNCLKSPKMECSVFPLHHIVEEAQLNKVFQKEELSKRG